jgi:hypothetical protein
LTGGLSVGSVLRPKINPEAPMTKPLLLIALTMLGAGSGQAADPAPAASPAMKPGVFCDTQQSKDCQAAVTPQQALATAAGQYPVAGNIVNEDILGSREFASKVAGSKLIIVLGHTSCGAIKGACDNVKLGNLSGLLARMMPAVAAVPDDRTDRTSKNYGFVEKVANRNVHVAVQQIREQSPILKEMEDKGEIMIVGAVYDVKSGKVT